MISSAVFKEAPLIKSFTCSPNRPINKYPNFSKTDAPKGKPVTIRMNHLKDVLVHKGEASIGNRDK